MKLYGKNPVFERLRSNPASIRKIYLQQGFSESAYVFSKAKQKGIPVMTVPGSKLQKMGRDKNTQGIMIDVDDFHYIHFEELLEEAVKKKRCPVFIDGLNDPQNLGAIIRTLGCLGKFSIVLPTHESVSVTEAVLRVASGGDNYVQIARVSNLNNSIKKAREYGFTIVGAVLDNSSQSLHETLLPFPMALVIGSERKGIRSVVLKNLDLPLKIPMTVHTMSMNASHATTIFCYEIIKQKAEYQNKVEARRSRD